MKKFKSFYCVYFVTILSFCLASCSSKLYDSDTLKIFNSDRIETIFVDSVWAGNRVNFALKTINEEHYIAYYDKDRNMVVAKKPINGTKWQKQILPNKLKWDSHNYVAFGIDKIGHIHVSGNMHADPLIYFRSEKPYDISTMKKVETMVDVTKETAVTYPKFFQDKDKTLYYSFRMGTSGNGNVFIYRYDTASKTWRQNNREPIFDGKNSEDNKSAYSMQIQDKDGGFHYIWMWRSTPLVESSHQIHYAKSSDLIEWANIKNENVSLSFLPNDKRTLVDDVPEKGGLHNGKYGVYIAPDGSPIILYLKYDAIGHTQLHVAKYMNHKWKVKPITQWDFRWKIFGGGDGMTQGADFKVLKFTDEDEIVIDWSNEQDQKGRLVLNLNTLDIVNKDIEIIPSIPPIVWDRLEKDKRMSTIIQDDNGSKRNDEFKYILRWETHPRSHGHNAPKVMPLGPRVPLYLLKIKQ